MGIEIRGRTRNPKKGMVTKRRAENRERGDHRKKMREEFRRLIPKSLADEKTANAISNRDVEFMMDEYMKRNDGGIAKKTRTF